MEKDVIIIPTLKTAIENIKDKKQIKLIYNGFRKIRELGLKAIKILYVRNEYILGEIKHKNPPYRLYVIINKTKNKFYLVDWQHKKNQQKAIGNLKSKLQKALKKGIKNILELFNR